MAHQKVSGLSGNEIYCLNRAGSGFKPGQLCIGNSVVAIGVAGGLGAGVSTLAGGEVAEVTDMVHTGRKNALIRLKQEAKRANGNGITGVSFDVINHGGYLEFITIGSAIHNASNTNDAIDRADPTPPFSTSADAQALYCQMDAGFRPLDFVFGNVAYSIGIGGNIRGAFRKLKRGEVPSYTKIFDETRHLALTRICAEAKMKGGNAVVGIETTISPILGTQEMMMVGTASHHPALTAYNDHPVSSDMTNVEMWNMVNQGYMPIKLVMGVSVYSLGLAGGIFSAFQSLLGGEVDGLTEILYEAREKALERIERDAEACGADEVVGVKTYVYDLGHGLVEFMAIGTAVKKIQNVSTKSETLMSQAVIRDQDTFIDSTSGVISMGGARAHATRMQSGPITILFAIFAVIFYVIKIVLTGQF